MQRLGAKARLGVQRVVPNGCRRKPSLSCGTVLVGVSGLLACGESGHVDPAGTQVTARSSASSAAAKASSATRATTTNTSASVAPGDLVGGAGSNAPRAGNGNNSQPNSSGSVSAAAGHASANGATAAAVPGAGGSGSESDSGNPGVTPNIGGAAGAAQTENSSSQGGESQGGAAGQHDAEGQGSSGGQGDGAQGEGGQGDGGQGGLNSGGGTGQVSGSDDSAVSDLPSPQATGVAKPSGAATGLQVLDWAGFVAAVSYTFDDSYTSQTDNYPALNATGARMTFYVVCNNNADNPVWSQAAQDGHEIGNHTLHHCHGDGTGCTWGDFAGSLAVEIEQCTDFITSSIGASVYTLAAPFGNTEWGEAAKASLFINRGAADGQVAPNDATDPYNLPCHIAAQDESASSLNQYVDSARNAGTWQLMLVHSLGGDGGASPVKLEDLLANMEHAVSGGDVWVDTVENVGAYWRAQKLFSTLEPVSDGETQTWSWTLPPHFPPGKFLRVVVDGGTLQQAGKALSWNEHGYYEVALDAKSLTLSL